MFMPMCIILGCSKIWTEKFLTVMGSNQYRSTQLYKMLTKSDRGC